MKYKAIENLARIEQKNAIKKGQFLSMFHTNSVKRLSENEKEEFFNYLKKKKIKRDIFIFLMTLFGIISFIAIIFSSNKLTGNAIISTVSLQIKNPLLFFFIFVLFVYLLINQINKKRYKRYNSHLRKAEMLLFNDREDEKIKHKVYLSDSKKFIYK